MIFQPNAFNKLQDCVNDEIHDWSKSDRAIDTFATRVLQNPNLPQVQAEIKSILDDSEIVDRTVLWTIVECKEISNFAKVVFVLGWGGMNPSHIKKVFCSYKNHWGEIVDAMLGNEICRFRAYEWFRCLKKNNKISHIGPAYFTKLIYFLEPSHRGYIMDQWTARSMNLLRNNPESEIFLNRDYSKSYEIYADWKNYWVDSDRNDRCIYQTFCEDLELLARRLELSPEHTEMLMFSEGLQCRTMGEWRKYVLDNTSCKTYSKGNRKISVCSRNCLGCTSIN